MIRSLTGVKCLMLGAGTALALLFVLATGVFRSKETGLTAGLPPPVISVDKNEWDFGFVRQEEAGLSHVFTFSNNGAESITLKVMHLGCNCVSADCPDSIPPHSKGEVRLNLEIRDREGYFGTRADIATSDPGAPTIQLALRFYAHPRVIIDPPYFQLTDVLRGDVVERELRVTKRLESEADSKKRPEMVISQPGVSLQYLDTDVEDGPPGGFRRAIHRYQLHVDTKALPASPRLSFDRVVGLRWPGTPTGEEKWIALEATFRHHRWLHGQTALVIQASEKGSEGQLSIWSRDGSPFIITKATSTVPEISAKPASKEPDKLQKVLVSMSDTSGGQRTVKKGYIDIVADKYSEEPFRVEVLVLP